MLSLDPSLMLENIPKQSVHARNSFKYKILKEDYQKGFKKVTLFFLLNSLPFDGKDYEKQKGSRNSDQSLFRLQDMFRKSLY